MPNKNTTLEQEWELISEGIYRWTIDCVNGAIEAAAKQDGGLKTPILGTGSAPLLSPTESKQVFLSLFEKYGLEALGQDESDERWGQQFLAGYSSRGRDVNTRLLQILSSARKED